MSDMSSLSHEYASTTDFSRQINEAVLLLKKRYLGGATTGISDEQSDAASDLLAETVRALRQRLFEDSTETTAESIPEDVLSRIEARHRGNLDYLRQDLSQLEQAFSQGAALGPAELQLLDSICEAADASASATFRKLWRR